LGKKHKIRRLGENAERKRPDESPVPAGSAPGFQAGILRLIAAI
jgi:hypothetical protein